MSRADVLVSADWPRRTWTPRASSSSRSTRTPVPTTVATSPGPSSWTGRPTCRTGAPRLRHQGAVRGVAVERASATTTPWSSTAATTTGSPRTRTVLKLYGHDKVQLLDGGRKKWELDGRELSKDTVSRPATTYTAKDQDTSIRAFATRSSTPSATRISSTCASPDEFSGKLLAPATCRRSNPQRRWPHPGRTERPVEQGANEDGTSSPTRT